VSTLAQYKEWVQQLPIATPPQWVHLPATAAERLLTNQASLSLSQWRQLNGSAWGLAKAGSALDNAQGIVVAKASAERLLAVLPKVLFVNLVLNGAVE